MSDTRKPGAAAIPPKWTAEREQEWRKAKYKRLNADLPQGLAARFIEKLHAQGKTYQGWLREQAEEMTKGEL